MQINFCFRSEKMMRPVYQLFLLAFLIISMSANSSLARQQDAQNTLLPEIDPQDIEIRSEFKARFPGLRRQPILGFNPNPGIYQIDPNRKPFMETQEEIVANLPVSDLARPPAPDYHILHYEPKINAFGRLGVGSFISPEAEFWGVYELSDKSYVGGTLDYHSSDGHLENRNTGFRFLNADAEFTTKLSNRTRFKLEGGLQRDFNYLADAPGIIYDGSKKIYEGFNLATELRNFKNSIVGWEAQAGYSYYGVDVETGDITPGTNEESVFNASFSKRWAGSHIQETFTLKLGGLGGQYTPGSFTGPEQWYTVKGGLEYQRLFNFSTRLTAEGGAVYASNAFETNVFVAPSVEIKHWLQDDLTVMAALVGRPYHKTLQQHHETNRFFDATGFLRHTYQVDGKAEIEFQFLEGSSLKAGISYMTAQNYPYYRLSNRSDQSGNGYGFYTLNYMNANRIRGYAGIFHQLVPEKFWISARAYIQKPKLNNGNDIPFEEQWGVNSGISVQPVKKLVFEAWADYVSERKTISSGTLDGFLLVGSRVDIQIAGSIGVYAKILNLMSQEYEIWRGYEERPLQVYGGVIVKLK